MIIIVIIFNHNNLIIHNKYIGTNIILYILYYIILYYIYYIIYYITLHYITLHYITLHYIILLIMIIDNYYYTIIISIK